MRFVDEAKIFVKGGSGGRGCISFRREAHEPRGGPNGGDGGRGGSVILQVDPSLMTLADFHYHRHFRAKSGEHGMGKDCYGHSGEDMIIRVPIGTLVKGEDGDLIADLSTPHENFVVARGGQGGRGNIHFTTSTNRAPRRADPGEVGEERWIHLELKLLADVGLIGKPNAGKSTLLSKITRAHPKIADYAFTTLTPQLGVVQSPEFPPFAVADIPGLIEGAHTGAGLGIRFLKHIEKTKIFLHLVDVSDSKQDPLSAYQEIRNELGAYNPDFLDRPEWVVLTKIDQCLDSKNLESYQKRFARKGFKFSTKKTTPSQKNDKRVFLHFIRNGRRNRRIDL